MEDVRGDELRMNVHGALARGISQNEYSPAFTSRPSSFTSWLNVTREWPSPRRGAKRRPIARADAAEQRAAARDRTAVDHGDVGERNRLIDAAALAGGVSLRVTDADARQQRRATTGAPNATRGRSQSLQ